MKKIIFLLLLFITSHIFLISIVFAQEEITGLSNNEIEILEKIDLIEFNSPKDFYAISKDKIIAVVDNSNLGYGNKVIKLITNGKEINRIEESNCKVFNLNFSGDGKWLSYGIRKRGEVARIKIYNVVNGDLKTIENPDKECAYLSFSPDCKKFVYSIRMDEGRKDNLVVTDFDGNQKVIVNNASFPKWSPIGDKIAFSRAEQVPGSRRWVGYIWIYNIDSGEEIKLHNSERMASYNMSWSPDGNKIASHNGHNLGIINVDTDQQINIGGIEAHGASWSPDGLKIAFIQPILNPENSDIVEDTEIYHANSDGTHMINLSNTPKISEKKPIWLNAKKIISVTTDNSGTTRLQENQLK